MLRSFEALAAINKISYDILLRSAGSNYIATSHSDYRLPVHIADSTVRGVK
jgi:hypothetical protein